MKATLVVEGKEFPIEINDPELQKLIIVPPKKTGYERVRMHQDYHIVYGDGEFASHGECHCDQDSRYYSEANYYSAEIVARNNARADRLMRQMRRFAVENRGHTPVFGKDTEYKWCIFYDYDEKILCCHRDIENKMFGAIYFNSKDKARLAIDTFHDELIWYFTEYKDSL